MQGGRGGEGGRGRGKGRVHSYAKVFSSLRAILSFLLPLFQEGQLSVTGESMCTKYWLTA